MPIIFIWSLREMDPGFTVSLVVLTTFFLPAAEGILTFWTLSGLYLPLVRELDFYPLAILLFEFCRLMYFWDPRDGLSALRRFEILPELGCFFNFLIFEAFELAISSGGSLMELGIEGSPIDSEFRDFGLTSRSGIREAGSGCGVTPAEMAKFCCGWTSTLRWFLMI